VREVLDGFVAYRAEGGGVDGVMGLDGAGFWEEGGMNRFAGIVEKVAMGILDESRLPNGLPGSPREHGFPGPFEQEQLFNKIRPGSRVTIVTPHGSKLTGRAMMRGSAGWVLNLGGAHGTPGIASEDNVIAVRG
jgi:hypothetical protein